MEIIEFLEKELHLEGRLAPSGWYRACCPIHGEHSPSFAVFTEYPFPYRCLSCGAHGQLPYLTSQVLSISLSAARELIFDRIKVVIDTAKLFRKEEKPEPVPEVLVEAYEAALTNSRTSRYCRSRNIPRFILECFGVGHDQLNLQMMIPMRSIHSGKVMGFDTRGFFAESEAEEKSSSLPKGLKSRVMLCPKDWRKKSRVVLVEGFFDAARVLMWLMRSGMEKYTVVAFGGVSVSDKQLEFLSRFDRIVLGYDNDKAGLRACEKLQKRLAHLPLYRLLFDGEDPGESSLDSFYTELYL